MGHGFIGLSSVWLLMKHKLKCLCSVKSNGGGCFCTLVRRFLQNGSSHRQDAALMRLPEPFRTMQDDAFQIVCFRPVASYVRSAQRCRLGKAGGVPGRPAVVAFPARMRGSRPKFRLRRAGPMPASEHLRFYITGKACSVLFCKRAWVGACVPKLRVCFRDGQGSLHCRTGIDPLKPTL